MTINIKLDKDCENIKYITSVEQIENMDADDVCRLTQNFLQPNVRLLLDVCPDAKTQMRMLNAVLYAKTVIDAVQDDHEPDCGKSPRIVKITAGHDLWWDEYRYMLSCNRRIELTDPFIPEDGSNEMSPSECATHAGICSLGENFSKYRSRLSNPSEPSKIEHDSDLAQSNQNEAEMPSEPQTEDQEQNPVITNCFTYGTDGMKRIVESIISQYGFKEIRISGAKLACIEAVFFKHRIITEPNKHKNFINALVAWGIIDESVDNINKILRQLTSKYSEMKVNRSDYRLIENEKDLSRCNSIASSLVEIAPSYRYRQ